MRKFRLGLSAAVTGALKPTILIGWLLASIVVAISGPFGTYEAHGLVWRLGYWGLVIGVAIPIGIVSRAFWEQVLEGQSLWVKDLVVIATLALIFGPLIVGFNTWLTSGNPTGAVPWPVASLVTFCVGFGLVTARRWVHETSPAEDRPQRDRLLDRIEAPQGARLVHVCSDNHHIRISTDDGAEYRILMRLRDALAEIDVEEGMSSHRSHWVAKAFIDGTDVVEGKDVVRLNSGRHVPIGPKYRPDLVTEGVLAA